jgi:hypothetical protein
MRSAVGIPRLQAGEDVNSSKQTNSASPGLFDLELGYFQPLPGDPRIRCPDYLAICYRRG